ncbi:MAG: hypothetical protein ABI325_09865 [Ginsengibacter sp.]
MKKLLFCSLFLSIMFSNCKKDKPAEREDGSTYPAKLTDIASAKFLDKAKGMGVPINLGDNPPNIAGKWKIAPFTGDGTVSVVDDAMLHIIKQENTSINLEKKYPTYGDPVLSQFIIGSGNNFTICHHFRMWGGNSAVYNFPYLMLISGTKDGNVLKNIKIAIIDLPWVWEVGHQKGDGGDIAIYYDKDGVSEKQ